ncbi:MAG: hypothetical protein R3243_16965 [Arenibacter latericius]|nr:hypothetical protein [Arenibacter latericius]
MKKEKLGQEPAFGDKAFYNPSTNCVETSGMYFGEAGCGMSKRFYAATKILQGFASDPSFKSDLEIIVETAYAWADELLRQEDL